MQDTENRLTSVAMPSGGTTTYFGNDPVSPSGYDDTTEEYGPTGTKTATYVHGLGVDEPLGFKTASWSSYHRDALGSVTRLTNVSGDVSTYRYDAFGRIRAQTGSGNTYRFTSREAEGSLYYNRARYYEPGVGRFLSADPSGLGGGMNQYAYAGGNPANRRDPSGLMLTFEDVGGGGGYGGGAEFVMVLILIGATASVGYVLSTSDPHQSRTREDRLNSSPSDLSGPICDQNWIQRCLSKGILFPDLYEPTWYHIIIDGIEYTINTFNPEWWHIRESSSGRYVRNPLDAFDPRSGKHWHAGFDRLPGGFLDAK